MFDKRIPIPWSMRWNRFRVGALPFLCLSAMAAATLALWNRQGSAPDTLGRVEAVRVNVAAGIDGRLLPLIELGGEKWEFLSDVREGDVVARLDDAPLRALLDALHGDMHMVQKELEAKRAELELERYDRQHEFMRESAELACAVEKARLEIVDHSALVEADRVELKKLDAQITVQKTAKAKGVITVWEMQEAEMNRDLVAKRLESNTTALRAAQEIHRLAAARQQRQPVPPELDLERILGPIRASIAAAEARVREVQVQIDNLEVRAPISGKISAIYFQPGQSVRAQDWIMTIGADKANHIVGYIRPNQRIRPKVGAGVKVRLRLPAAPAADSTVEHVGSQWEPLPLELAQDQKVTELVLPVRVKMPSGLQLRPGELVDLRFLAAEQSAAE